MLCLHSRSYQCAPKTGEDLLHVHQETKDENMNHEIMAHWSCLRRELHCSGMCRKSFHRGISGSWWPNSFTFWSFNISCYYCETESIGLITYWQGMWNGFRSLWNGLVSSYWSIGITLAMATVSLSTTRGTMRSNKLWGEMRMTILKYI